MKDLFEQFIKQQEYVERKRKKTIENYRQNFNLLFGFKPDLKLEDLTEETMIDFFEYLDTRERRVGKKMIVRKIKNSSIATIRGKLEVFFRWLVDREHIKSNPFEKIPYPEVSYTSKEAFTKEEFDKIFINIVRDIKWVNDFLRKRNTAMIMTLVLTGIRREELLELKLSDIDWKNKKITIRDETSKSKRTRTIPMSPDLRPFLEDYLITRTNKKNSFLWVNGRDEKFTEHGWKHLVKKLKEETETNFRTHRFRHTFACNYYRQRKDPVGLQKMMGHQDIKTTFKVYLRSIDDDDLTKEMNKFKISKFY